MVHLIYKGRGWLVFAITFGVSLLGNVITDACLGKGFYDTHKWPLALSLAVAGAICWPVGLRLNKVADRIPGQKFPHTFFFIPMQYWGPLLFVFAAIADLADYFR